MKPDLNDYPRTQHGLKCSECGTELYSNSRHDFVECQCGSLYLDGGFDYSRYGGTGAMTATRVERTLERRPPPYFAQEQKR